MKKSSVLVEQVDSNGNIKIDYDHVPSKKEILDDMLEFLGRDASITKISNKNVIIYKNYCLLIKSITYLGNPHPKWKKRIQLDKEINNFYNQNKYNYDIRLIGYYTYDENVVIVDFDKSQYMGRNLNNSSAHVYVSDLYNASKDGIFKKTDYNGNIITCISKDLIKSYFDGEPIDYNTTLIDEFIKFNEKFPFNEWITAEDAIKQMKESNFPDWKQAEWAGFFLEYAFSKFIQENPDCHICYVKQKKDSELDFDIYFKDDNFYGDLKSSDENKKECPANDKDNFVNALEKYSKFWYVIYEHDTIKDTLKNNEMAIKRMKLIGKEYKLGDEISYKSRMKHSIKFTKMSIIELNKSNFKHVLKDFNQGHQYKSNIKREPKFSIDKKFIKNFVIYAYKKEKNV